MNLLPLLGFLAICAPVGALLRGGARNEPSPWCVTVTLAAASGMVVLLCELLIRKYHAGDAVIPLAFLGHALAGAAVGAAVCGLVLRIMARRGDKKG